MVTVRQAYPKRLLLLMAVYAIVALWGLYSQLAVMPALLTLLMLLAIAVRHKAGLWLLRGYAVTALLLLSLLPYLFDVNPELLAQWQHSTVHLWLQPLPPLLLLIVSLLLAMLQLWWVFSAKVSRFFIRDVNFNIIR